MSILVNPHNEQEEKELLAQYNREIDDAEAEIDNEVYFTQDEVEKIFEERRKTRNGD